MGREVNAHSVLMGEPGEKRRLEIAIHRRKDNIKLVHNWDGWAWTGFTGSG